MHMSALNDFRKDYVLRTDVGDGYADQLRWVVRGFEAHLQRAASVSDLSHEQINSYLAHLRKAGYAGETRRSRRRMLLTLASDAARLRLIEPTNRDMVARVKVVPKMPDGLTWEQARHVIICLNSKATKHNKWLSFRYRKTGLVRRDFWRAYLSAAWDTGAPADLRALRWDELQADGRVFRLRHKTGKTLHWALSTYTMEAIARLATPERELVFPLSGGLNLFRRDVRKILVEIAGLENETLGGFRSGAGTDAEMHHGRGAGCQLLGNTPEVFVKHYEIPELIRRPALAPRPLMDDMQESEQCQQRVDREATGS
jgi:hypothetical protein